MSSPRNQNIELLRIFAAFGIVLFHASAPGASIGYGGLIVFIALTTHFSGKGINWRRLVIPWAFWMLAYGAANWLTKGNAFPEPGLLAAVLYGTSPHLWYLPFAFALVCLFSLYKPPPVVGGLMAIAFLAAAPWWREAGFAPPVAQWVHAGAAVGIGLALRSKAGIALVAFGLAIAAVTNVQGVAISYLAGGIALLVAVATPSLPLKFGPVSNCTFGIYLVHGFALAMFNRITGESQLLTVVCAFVASLVGVYLARRFVPMTKLVLG